MRIAVKSSSKVLRVLINLKPVVSFTDQSSVFDFSYNQNFSNLKIYQFPLITNKKVVLSPHSATFTKEGLENMAIETAQNIIDFFENKIENTKIVKL